MLCRLAALLAARQLMCPVETVLLASTREAPVAAARQLAMYLAHVGLGLSQHQVAVGFARHRRTVAHACNRVEDRRDDANFDAQLTDIECQIRWTAGR
ncbi:helix-turn-helix domain-containing protein [Azorhizobium sp. AG788]|uniref:helix-turn-helix domain-containing protein n=1 Tax=Azorhizobium sp. AG788 TaxID=2183897 RepID=UPI00313995A0